MKRMTKPFAVLATLALSVTAFQGVVAANETKPANPTAPVSTEQKPVDKKVDGKTDSKATDNKKDGKANTTTPPANEKNNKPAKNTAQKELEIDLTDTEKGIKAQLKGVKEARGTWTLLVGGQVIISAQGGASYEFNLTDPKVEAKLAAIDELACLEVQFEGTTTGTPVKGNGKDESPADIPVISVKTEVNDSTLTLNAKIKDAKEGKGQWIAFVSKTREFNDKDLVNGTRVKGDVSEKFTFKDLKPGTYYVLLTFKGIVDGKEKETCTVVQVDVPKGGTPSTGTNTGTGTKTPTPVKPTPISKPVTKEQAKKAVEKAEGGQLPKTATSYPIATIAGAAILMVGAGLFFVARRRKQKQQ
ncbi:LPXTG-motif cell wall-anchored protein [Croceifilum oryzae]|uniref:LPXTG-motif cell wall-anchored protein n=1 Tax=Croceifilum oryzae TaxID=1553429 RepID=A0AAJ1TG55_9BACL|nr:LPXTG cell wall anchor domain-containing protein [Croceifilum oryzae]MDQ0415937.1 LPXTG-motif cell wall-anchored protein [Croceifilum oryzae]